MASPQASTWGKPLLIAGAGLSSFVSGFIASMSLTAIPPILTLPTNSSLLTAWRTSLMAGGSIAIPTFFTASAIHAVNAYLCLGSSSTLRAKYLGVAAAATLATAPFTMLFIVSINARLLEQEEEAKGTVAAPDPSAVELIKMWSRRNLIRSLLPAAGALAAFLAPE